MVVWMIFRWKSVKLGDHWIKGHKSPSEANSTLLRLFLIMPKSSLMNADSNIDMCTIRSEFNQKSIWQTLFLRMPKSLLMNADSNIDLCTIRSEFNQKSIWWTWNRKHLNLTLQMEYMWNFNGIHISFASNNIGRRVRNQRWQHGSKSK